MTINYMAIPGLNRGGAIQDKMPTVKDTTIRTILRAVCMFHDIQIKDLWKKTREQRIVTPRQRAHYFCRKLTTKSLTYIGKKVGGMDHATVLHSTKDVENLMETYPVYKEEMERLYESITNSISNNSIDSN